MQAIYRIANEVRDLMDKKEEDISFTTAAQMVLASKGVITTNIPYYLSKIGRELGRRNKGPAKKQEPTPQEPAPPTKPKPPTQLELQLDFARKMERHLPS